MQVVTDSPARWAQIITDSFISLRVRGADDGFEGSLRRCDLGGGVRLTAVGTRRCRVCRDESGVRADGSDDLLLLSPLTGTATVRQEGTEQVIGPGSASVHVADRPYELEFDGPSQVIVLQAPRTIVPSSALVSPERRRSPSRGGLVRVFRAFATELLAATEELSARDRDELGVTAAGLAVSVLGAARPEPTRHLVTTARAFVHDNLADPDLSPSTIAAHCRVSVRLLQLAFAEDGGSPAAYIRAERVRAAQRLLGDGRYSALSVGQVARRVGFTDVTVFIRVFTRRTGSTPGRWRVR
ncbi:helix-turn-helix domain-containing protein [Pseudonocardia spinosispora]|uniref:helix-turn-helix domain-containing protein n=1 Tax=Pseudonocardia spinosispora TaxID=103441 RepID=UPI00041E17C0|nr:helix-turn-helix domain-containing protein [Pseudonocardia spinosispora]